MPISRIKTQAVLAIVPLFCCLPVLGSQQSSESLKNAAISAALPSGDRSQASQDAQVASDNSRPKVGLALGGGGTRGAAHVGVLKVLKEAGVPIDCIAGTSMGAIVGGLYSAGVSIDQLERCFDDVSLMHAFMTVPLDVRIAAAPILVVTRLVHHPYDGLYAGNKFRKYLDRLLPGCSWEIEKLKIPYCAVALNVVDGKPYAITSGDLGYAMQASSAVPGLRKPVQIGDNLYVDGGVVANVPVEQVKELGAQIVIAVDVDERVKGVPLDSFRKVGSISRRMLLLQLAHSDAPLLVGADVIVHPDVDGIKLISTHSEDAKKALQAGEDAARQALPDIKEKLAKAGIKLKSSGQ